MTRIIRAICTWWFLRTIDRRFDRAHPELKKRRQAIAAARKAHRKTKPLLDAQRDDMLRLLREGQRP
ncbi:hypothetical protein [Ensifer adhaerens]|uniref:hypothetical protein n=1 Tax=Ensifer adhaerens TaxID=106592 RepID=UPI00098F4E33|nr:hypothetical protein [Ensifer adhaerens]